jgi:hypothetical protein
MTKYTETRLRNLRAKKETGAQMTPQEVRLLEIYERMDAMKRGSHAGAYGKNEGDV